MLQCSRCLKMMTLSWSNAPCRRTKLSKIRPMADDFYTHRQFRICYLAGMVLNAAMVAIAIMRVMGDSIHQAILFGFQNQFSVERAGAPQGANAPCSASDHAASANPHHADIARSQIMRRLHFIDLVRERERLACQSLVRAAFEMVDDRRRPADRATSRSATSGGMKSKFVFGTPSRCDR